MKLKINFSGLCLFVPNEQNQAMTVLMMDARNPGVPKSNPNARFFPHIPALTFNSSNLVEEPTPTSNPRFDYVCNSNIVWPLDGDDLRLKVDCQDFELGSITRTKDFNDMIPSLSKIYAPQGLDVDSSLLAEDMDSRLVGRFRLSKGVLDIPKSEARLVKATFPNLAPNTYSDLASYTVDIPEAKEIELCSINKNKTIRLASKNQNTIQISLTNMPPKELMAAFPFEEDKDFEMVYWAAAKQPSQMHLYRHVRAHYATVHPLFCVMAIYNSHPLA